MADIINFGVERAKRKSGLNNTALLEDMVAEGYDPCDPMDIEAYYEWIKFQNIIYDDIDIGHNWSDDALNRLFEDIKNFDPTKNITYTVDVNMDEIKELVIDTKEDLDFTNLLPTKPV